MESIHFETTVGHDRIIRAPANVPLPEGIVEVTIRPVVAATACTSDSSASSRLWLLELAAESERSAPALPADMAEHHDHYAHGTPLP